MVTMPAASHSHSNPLSLDEWAALAEDEPGELVDGWIVEEEVPDNEHEIVVGYLVSLLRIWAHEDFRRAYDPNGMKPSEFDTFGATARTMRTFIGSYYDLVGFIRDLRLPNPD